MCCPGCFSFLGVKNQQKSGCSTPGGAAPDRETFEKTISFLQSVPLFKRQLPKAELPLLAQALERKHWEPNEILVKQGDIGDTFFLIVSGRAAVLTELETDKGQQRQSGTLGEGDWLGGHTLVQERANVATVVALGPEALVTLQMSKQVFKDMGLNRLRCPKRPAMRGELTDVDVCLGSTGSMCRVSSATPMGSLKSMADLRSSGRLQPEEVEFVLTAISKNKNLWAFCERFQERRNTTVGVEEPAEEPEANPLKAIAANAERREVKAGEVLAHRGSLGQEFFVVYSGEVEVLADLVTAVHRTAEEAAAAGSAAERLRRKEHFMLQLASKQKNTDRTKSLFAGHSMHAKKQTPQPTRSRPHAKSLVFKNKGGTKEGTSDSKDKEEKALTVFGEGESFGELSLLYNTRREATFRATVDSVVYVISRRQFKKLIDRRRCGSRVEEYAALLDEVDVLAPLLRSELRELASNASALMTFEPDQRVLSQGKVRKKQTWYVIQRGTARMSRDGSTASGAPRERLPSSAAPSSEIGRGGHFGARTLIEDTSDGVYDVNVDAGSEGMTCLCFDGELVSGLLKGLFQAMYGDDYAGGTPGLEFNFEPKALRGRNEVCKASLESLREKCVLGKGGFGCVMLVEDTEDKERKQYALKRISKGHAQAQDAVTNLCWERDLLSMLNSGFVDHLYKTYMDDQFVYFLLEPALGGDLWAVLNDRPETFTQDEPRGSAVTFCAACIVLGLEHLHQRKIVYRDLKPENVMVDTEGYIKICDMGLARFVIGKTNTQVGTPDYMAPEMIDPPHDHDVNVDWWALGVLCFELVCRQPPFDDDGLDDAEDRLLAIRRSQESTTLRFTFACPVQVKGFITKCLKPLSQRIGSTRGVEEIKNHLMFQRPVLDFEALRCRKIPSPLAKPWVMPNEPEFGGLHSTELPVDDDIFVKYPFEDNPDERFYSF